MCSRHFSDVSSASSLLFAAFREGDTGVAPSECAPDCQCLGLQGFGPGPSICILVGNVTQALHRPSLPKTMNTVAMECDCTDVRSNNGSYSMHY